jgi:hypothetical protein
MRCVERVERASYVVSFLAQAWVEGKVRCPSARLDPDVVAISRWQHVVRVHALRAHHQET